MKIANSRRPPPEALDAETMLAAAELRRADQARQLAATSRQAARAERLDHLERGAKKLEEMAHCALGSKLLGFVAWAGEKLIGPLAEKLGQGGTVEAAIGQMLGATNTALQVTARLDPFELSRGYAQVDKQRADTAAEVCSFRAQDAGDRASDAQRRVGFLVSLAEKLADARHSARLAALRG